MGLDTELLSNDNDALRRDFAADHPEFHMGLICYRQGGCCIKNLNRLAFGGESVPATAEEVP